MLQEPEKAELMLLDTVPGESLSSAGPSHLRSSHTFARAQRHSRRVQVLKIAVPIIALLVAGTFGAASYLLTPKVQAVAPGQSAISDGKLVMANPKLEGVTRDNRPYSMSALRATQNIDTPDRVALEQITAKLPLGTDQWATLESKSGLFDRKANTLEFDAPVAITTTDGQSANLKTAFIDITKNEISSKDPVSIVSRGMQVNADSMTITDKGRTMTFERRVKVIMQPGGQQASLGD